MEFEYNSVKYKCSVNLSGEELLFKVESFDQKYTYQEHFSFEKLQKTIAVLNFKDINQYKEKIKTLIVKKSYKISMENDAMIFHFDIMISEFDMKLLLKPKSLDFNFNSFSQDIQEIIKNNKLVLGIDFGTTYSTASIIIDKDPIIIPNDFGQKSTPSYITFIDDKNYYVGDLAKLTPSFDKNTIYGIKRLIGRKFNEAYYDKSFEEIKKDQDFPFEIIKDPISDKIKIVIEYKRGSQIFKKDFYPEQLCAILLKKLKINSEYYLYQKLGKETKIHDAVITVPAYFNQLQRKAIKESAEMIDLNVKRIINEPTSASLAYGYEKEENESNSILVVDFGGGTLDITILYFTKDNTGIYCDIKSSNGHANLGGDDFDLELMKYCLEQNNLDSKIIKNLSKSIRLKKACEKAKIELSSETKTIIKLENYQNLKDINISITRDKFNELSSTLFAKFEKMLDKIIKDYKDINVKSEIKKIILVGGSTFIPKIREIICEKFPNIEIIKNTKDDALYAVSKGAAILGAKESNLNNIKDFYLIDVVNLPLGVETEGGIMSPIIEKNHKINFDKSELYKTVKDEQTVANILIYEGENEKVKDNFYLGQFSIDNLPKKKAGEAKIKIQFFYDKDSIVNVKAFDLNNEDNYREKKIEQIKIFNDGEKNNLKIEAQSMEEIYIYNYEIYKNDIISLEEKIRESDYKEKHMLDLIDKLSDLLEKICYPLEIYISLVKYYFWKIYLYLAYMKGKKIDNSFYKTIGSNIKNIFNISQFYNENENNQENTQSSINNDDCHNILEEITDELINNAELHYFFLEQITINYINKVKEYLYTLNLKEHRNVNDIYKISYNYLNKVEKIFSKLKKIKPLEKEMLNYLKMKEDLHNLLEIIKSAENNNETYLNETIYERYMGNSLNHLIVEYFAQKFGGLDDDEKTINNYRVKIDILEKNNYPIHFITESLFFIIDECFKNDPYIIVKEERNILCDIKGYFLYKNNLKDLNDCALKKLYTIILFLLNKSSGKKKNL